MRVTRNKVETILREYPETRSSDKKLLLKIWELDGLYLTEDQQKRFLNSSTAESVTRARRALKEKYPATEQVNEYRYSLFKEYRNDYAFERDCS